MYQLFKIELYKIFRKPRTYISFIAIGLIVGLIQLAFKSDGGTLAELLFSGLKGMFEFNGGNLLNGYFVAYRFLPSFITSLACMQIAKGVGSVFTKTQSVTWPTEGNESSWFHFLVRWGSIPTGLILLCIVAAICAIVLHKTKAGRYILCIGSNKEAVRLSGVNTKKWEMLAYIICGLLAGVAAIFYVGAYTTVQPGLGDTFNNEAIAACVMGGTSMAGGLASMLGTVIGAIIIALMQEGILAMGFTISYQYVITGIIVLIAVTADTLSRKRKN